MRSLRIAFQVRQLPLRIDVNPESKIQVSTTQVVRPVQDEWGFYDPEQAGFEAVLRKLSVSDDDADGVTPSTPNGSR